MKKYFVLISFFLSMPFIVNASSITLKDGSQLECQGVWEEGNDIKCFQNGKILSYPKNQISLDRETSRQLKGSKNDESENYEDEEYEEPKTDNLDPVHGSAKRVQHEIEKALGNSNRKVTKVSKVQTVGESIHVFFSIDDNLTKGMIKRGAKMDIESILKAVQKSGYNYIAITAIGTFLMIDKFGNSREDKVLQATYNRSTVDRVNWDGFLTDNVYNIADSIWLHPAFR